jgi:oligopeptide/dipeptide ABC transporter ATP-binding protein
VRPAHGETAESEGAVPSPAPAGNDAAPARSDADPAEVAGMAPGVPVASPPRAADEPLLTARELCVTRARPGADDVFVHGVCLTVRRHQTVAIVGESGSGKSLTALALTKLTPPGFRVTAEVLRLDDTDIASLPESGLREIRGRRISMVFQNPMSALNPVIPVGRQITQVLSRHKGLRGRRARDRAVELLNLVEVPDPARRVRQYPFEMSGGMLQRVMIAMALSCGPDLLIADEPTTALDTTLQAQIMELLRQRQRDLGMGLLLISHDLGLVASEADEVNVMYAGRVVEHADVKTLFESPAHPYTRALLGTVREIASVTQNDLAPIPGAPPRLEQPPPGCPFAPRCPMVLDRCRAELPELRRIRDSQQAACHRAGE